MYKHSVNIQLTKGLWCPLIYPIYDTLCAI